MSPPGAAAGRVRVARPGAGVVYGVLPDVLTGEVPDEMSGVLPGGWSGRGAAGPCVGFV
ncbi:hypothetical protein [Streptomyces griseosporeus]|uniref:hypothetical protein n=1 Tax=Streptomyces griseosporeus TaxID=1910 RepID=UPI003675FA9A